MSGGPVPKTLIVVDDQKTAEELRSWYRSSSSIVIASLSEVPYGRRFDIVMFSLRSEAPLRVMEWWHDCVRPGGLVIGSPYVTRRDGW